MSPIHVLPNCKVSEKSNERFSRNGRTDERDSLGVQRLRRETKKADDLEGSLHKTCPRYLKLLILSKG